MPPAKKWLCAKCGNELGIVMANDRLRFGQTEGQLPVQAKCKCGFRSDLHSYQDCHGPETDTPPPLLGY